MVSPYEKKRRGRLVRGSERDAFTVGCALLRIIIGCLIGVPPAHVELDRTCPECGEQHGKPMTRIAAGLECSVSHSGEKVVVAIARYPIGVDVQRIERELDIDEAAAQILTASELASFRQIPADDRLWGLLAYWTPK